MGKLDFARHDQERIGNIKLVLLRIWHLSSYMGSDLLDKFGTVEFSDTLAFAGYRKIRSSSSDKFDSGADYIACGGTQQRNSLPDRTYRCCGVHRLERRYRSLSCKGQFHAKTPRDKQKQYASRRIYRSVLHFVLVSFVVLQKPPRFVDIACT